MIPKKAKDFKKPTAEELNLPEDLINNLVNFYWENIRKHMSELTHGEIRIQNFGTFRVKHWTIADTVEKHKATILRVEGKFAGYRMKLDLTDRIEKLEKIKSLVQEREEKFKAIRDARNNKNNMEEQGPDMGGLSEQSDQEGTCREDS